MFFFFKQKTAYEMLSGDWSQTCALPILMVRPGTAIGAVGVARAAYELAVDYSRERVQFGQPIAMNQGVNFLIADMVTNIEAARLLCWQAAWMLDSGYGRKATLYSSMAKRFAADMAMEVTTDAVQIFGEYKIGRASCRERVSLNV